MLVVGLTGGIGSGKTTVARMLAAQGATVIDTDAVAREVVEPGRPAYADVVERFGRNVVRDDGQLDRAALAELAFADERARGDLNAIVHPAVAREVAATLAGAEARGDQVVVLEVPLLVEAGWDDMVGLVVVVDCPEEVAVRRLVEARGMPEADARRRIAAQAGRSERRARADVVLDNTGSLDDLRRHVGAFWSRLKGSSPQPP